MKKESFNWIILVVSITFLISFTFFIKNLGSNRKTIETTEINVEEKYLRVQYYVALPGIYRITTTAIPFPSYSKEGMENPGNNSFVVTVASSYGWTYYLNPDREWLLKLERIGDFDPNAKLVISVKGKEKESGTKKIIYYTGCNTF